MQAEDRLPPFDPKAIDEETPKDVIAKLKDAGAIYESFSTPEEVEARHREAGRDPKLGYDGFDRDLTDEQAWKALEPLTKLGIELGKLNAEIEIPEDIPYLGIKAGKMDVQRFFYWNICKAYYRPEFTLDEMNHINFDWYVPTNAHRQSPEEVRAWCTAAGLTIEREVVEDAGITVIARKA